MKKSRVIISNVQPQVENGMFPAKAIVGESYIISADIFTDGHDEIASSLFIKCEDDKKWTEIAMRLTVNDHWETSFIPEKAGHYQFKIQAWQDHYTTWTKGLRKKFDAGQDISVELQIGAQLAESSLIKAGRHNKQLKELAGSLGNLQHEEAVSLALSDANMELMRAASSREDAAQTGIYVFEAERKKAGFSTWYELFPRSAAAEPGKHGTFGDVERLLPRIAKMGFDVLYLPPIHPIGEKNRKGKNNSLNATEQDPGSPWAIGSKDGGHKDINPLLGSLKDFKNLVKAAEQNGIEIAMDIAYQCAPDHPYVKEHPQWFKWRPDGTVQYAENPPKKYEDILPINFDTEDREGLWNELKSVVEYWIGNGVDIFRVDNPHTKAFPFWEWMIGEVRKNHPQVIFLAEAFTRPRTMEWLAKIGFSQSYTYFTWRNTKKELEEYLTELTKSPLRHYFRPNFWPNTPDILPPELTAGGENAHIMRLILAATMSSNYGLYGPVYEFGLTMPMPGKEEYIDNEKYEIKHWDWEARTRIGEIMARLNRIRKENPALQTTWNIEFAETSNEQIICYTKTDPATGNILIITVNLDPYHTQSAHVRIPLKKAGIRPGLPYIVHDLLSGDRYTWQDEWNYVQLNPNEMPAHLFKVEQE
jgi:starch synthase (maltosyl-transferring)